jgi:hypothetical protein
MLPPLNVSAHVVDIACSLLIDAVRECSKSTPAPVARPHVNGNGATMVTARNGQEVRP